MSELDDRCRRALNRLSKWKTVLCGRRLGTRPVGDPEADDVRDQWEYTLMLRCEVTALVSLLVKKGVLTLEDYQKSLIEEAALLEKDYERRFPGMRASDIGMRIDVQKARETMKGWKP